MIFLCKDSSRSSEFAKLRAFRAFVPNVLSRLMCLDFYAP